MPIDAIRQLIAEQGFAVVPEILSSEEVRNLIEEIESSGDQPGVRSRAGIYAIRNLLDIVPAIRDLAHSPRILRLVQPTLGPDAKPVRGTLFDKTPTANWKVPWHQDLTIAVNQKKETPGYGPWTVKAGVTHVQPPAAILAAMLAVRIHLDACDETNGALRIIPGTHLLGRLSSAEIRRLTAGPPTPSAVPTGGALIMHPLLLHASSPAITPGHRRVIHLEFAASPLPDGLEWYSAPTVLMQPVANRSTAKAIPSHCSEGLYRLRKRPRTMSF